MKKNKNVSDMRIGAFVNWPVLSQEADLKKTPEWEQPILTSDAKPKSLRKIQKQSLNKRGFERNV